jgi:hypothetical protein
MHVEQIGKYDPIAHADWPLQWSVGGFDDWQRRHATTKFRSAHGEYAGRMRIVFRAQHARRDQSNATDAADLIAAAIIP